MNLLKNYKRAKQLLAEDNKRLEMEKAQRIKEANFMNELKSLDQQHLDYILRITEIDTKAKELNLATLYRELNRVKLSLYVLAPTLYLEAFGSKPCVNFDTVYIRNSEMSSYAKSLTEIEKMLTESCKKDIWPPQKIDLDCFEDAVYYSLFSTINAEIKKLQKFLNIVATLN